MSMSCQMGFYYKNAALEDYEILVYQHNDGEPEVFAKTDEQFQKKMDKMAKDDLGE